MGEFKVYWAGSSAGKVLKAAMPKSRACNIRPFFKDLYMPEEEVVLFTNITNSTNLVNMVKTNFSGPIRNEVHLKPLCPMPGP